jgi:dTDP-4-dehydrorhamnose 3,5-epimerase
MKFTALDIAGGWLIDADAHADERGVFRRHFCAKEFADRGITATVVQGNISENPHIGTLRGFHYQEAAFAEAKTVSCLSGALYAIVVDLRRTALFMHWVPVELSGDNRRSLHVPKGCAMAWLTTAPNTVVHYYMSEAYAPASYRGIRYDDPAFGFRWPAAPKVISEKDRTYPDFDPKSVCAV